MKHKRKSNLNPSISNFIYIWYPYYIKNGRTFVPVRFAAENLNCKVDWFNSTKEAVLIYEE